MKQHVKTILGSPRLPYILLFTVMLAFHLFVQYTPGDEAYYGSVLQAVNGLPGWLSWVQEHYITWSSRVLVDSLLCVFSSLPVLVWRLADPILIAAAAWMLAYAFRLEKQVSGSWLACILVFLYQWPYLADAGWVVTSISYGWTTELSLIGLGGLFTILRGGRVKPWQWLLFCLPLLVGLNMEQSALLLCFLLGSGVLYLLGRRQKVPAGLWAQLILAFASLAFVLTCPGNQLRAEEDIYKFYLNYPMLDVLKKAEIGISGAIASNVYGRDSIFYLFAVLVAVAAWETHAPALARWLALAPCFLLLPLSIFRYQMQAAFPPIAFFTGAYSAAGYITFSNFGQPLAYLPMLLGYGLFALCLLGIFGSFGFSWRTAQVWGLLAMGGISQSAMGFTPSVAVSSRRTGIYFSFCIIAACLAVWQAMTQPGNGQPGQQALPLKKGSFAALCSSSLVLCAIQAVSLFEMC